MSEIQRGIVELLHDLDRRARPGREPKNRAISKFQTLADTVQFSSETVTTTVQTPPYQYALQSYRSSVIAATPTSYWRFGETAPAVTANDERAAANHAPYSTGVLLGYASAGQSEPVTVASFPGVAGQRVAGPAGALSLDGLTAFALELWANPGNGIVDLAQPFSKIITAPSRNGVAIYYVAATKKWNAERSAGGASLTISTSSGDANVGSWSQIAITYDGTTSASAFKLFTNGTQRASGLSTGSIVATTAVCDIGGGTAAIGTAPFLGLIGEVATYPPGVSSTQISDHYLAMTAPAATGTPLIVGAGQFR